jgi:predicted alpha-1,2-mannosidase
MRRVLALVLACVALAPAGARASEPDLASYVDPLIGTLGSGFVFPGPAAPYGMVQLSPDTEGYFAYTGYMWFDQLIRGFSHVHVESMGVPEGGNVPFMPTIGEVVSTDVMQYQTPYVKASEQASPGYYSVLLDNGVRAELTAGTRVGMHRYTFPAGAQANVLLDVGRQIPDGSELPPQRVPGANKAFVRRVDDRTVIGSANIDRAAEDHYPVHFAARFSRPMTSFGVWSTRGGPVTESDEVTGVGAGAVVSFDDESLEPVVVEVGVSFVSPDNALGNLDGELAGAHFDFDALRHGTRDAWNEALGAIRVEGGTLADTRSFYTALYHAQHHPNVFNDLDGRYLGHDDQIHTIGEPGDPMTAGSTYYANFSLWDTYRAEKPLLALIAPDRFRDFMRSFAAIVRWGGRLPRWSLMNRHADFMNGEPALQVFADGFCRGLVPPESLATIYDDAVVRALEQRRNPAYLTRGWVDASATLEHALGDFSLALVADRLGEAADRDALLGTSSRPDGSERGARSWRNVFDPETRFVRPRNADGSWVTPFMPEDSAEFTEGTAWQYTWLVPHDIAGLYDAIGDDAAVTDRLDTFFAGALAGTQPWPEVQQKLTLYGIAYYGNQYAPSNEHDLQAPWLYNWVGQPSKTQAIQRAYQSLYRPAPDGLPGNDDLGTMSAWYVWSALGFYPVTPGSPTYTFGSPVFERATIRLPGDDAVVEAPGASLASKYIQGVTLDGDPVDDLWFTHDALAGGGRLRIEMGPAPSDWGTDPAAAPPSATGSTLDAFACTP